MDYEATGGIRLYGCASFVVKKRYLTKFAVGGRAYIKFKAQHKGKLESVVVKKINLASPLSSYAGIAGIFNYVDTLNRVWLEEELAYQSEAVTLATEYWQAYAAEAEALIQNTCSPL
jgi:hypothetical protein